MHPDRIAARDGNLEFLQNRPIHPFTLCDAAKHGRLEIIQWFWENGQIHDHHICYYAAEGGNPEIIRWAVRSGMPLECVVRTAAINGRADIIEWLAKENDPHGPADYSAAYAEATERGHHDVASMIRKYYGSSKARQPVYHGWNCHAYTRDLAETLREIPVDFSARVEPQDFAELVREMKKQFPRALAILNKISSRYDARLGGYPDPDLPGVNVAQVLEKTYRLCRKLEIHDLLQETLLDIGQTCVQGDSHRLLSLWLALYRDGH